MSTVKRPCPACGSGRSRPAGTKDGHPLVCCASCGTLHTADVPHDELLHSLYTDYYDASNLAIPDFVARRLDDIVGGFAPHRVSNRLLDVGFGAATLLEAARRAGWAAEGVEVSEGAVQHAASKGFKVTHGALADAAYPSAAFDVVTAVEVLEHVIDPLSVVQEIARILRPGGLLWATTPHGRGISWRLLGARWSVVSPPEHIQLFSVRGIRNLLHRGGFRDVRVASHGVNPLEILSHVRGRAAVRGCDRVASSYQVNAFFSERPSRRAAKAALNGILSSLRLGDGLKVHATL